MSKVLIFSRRAEDRDYLTKTLGSEDYEVILTDNGPEAIIQALSGGLEAVVILLQRKSHRELEYIPCLNSIDQNLPVIVISDHDSLKLQREIRKHKVFYYLPRPVDGPMEGEEIRAALKDAVASTARKR